MHGEADHLCQMAHRRLAGVVLPVGVGDEADGRVECEIRRYAIEASRIQRQQALEPLHPVENQKAGDGEREHRKRIDKPVLLARRVHASQAIKAALDGSQHGTEKVFLACVNIRNEFAERELRSPAPKRAQARSAPNQRASSHHLLVLEFFGVEQCVEEVEAEPDGDDQSDDRFTHQTPLKLTQRERVEAHQRQSR